MQRQGERIFLEKKDIIRINQFVRDDINYDAFLKWYEPLQGDEQSTLIAELCHFAYQAGVDEAVSALACEKSGFRQDCEFVERMEKVRTAGGLNIDELARWLSSAKPDERQEALRWFVHLFGVAEQRVIEIEKGELCNHWWHRNLKDERVVQSILNDPEYHRTSPWDDLQLQK